jgi:hypothetical protein
MDERFVGGAPLALGVDPFGAPAALSAGDQILLGLVIRKSGTETVRFLDLRMAEPLRILGQASVTVRGREHSESRYVTSEVAGHVRLLDERGRVLKEGDGRFAARFLSSGLMEFARVLEAEHARPRTPDGRLVEGSLEPHHREILETGICTLLSFAASVNNNSRSIFRGMAMDFIGLRGLIAAVFGTFTIDTDATPTPGTARLPGMESDLLAYALPVRVGFGNAPVMDCVLTVVEPLPPLTLTAGIVRAEITRPSAPDDRITVQLLAARHGGDQQISR